ncbi:hypothetical protein COX08_03810 [Candidatus Beckwithbacteria bacterium CG23_combo_of_CG06-09_8_20_14_all_34_8]|uniref:Uncharacterized protein n=1 Tax=Candidatus Beckwithbacteria bacterium CG23_combo_of_CG06-09_8_20_14_all_34_8 TaxID=1974497 RepID=A0A2H0B5L2_9BACT|nr:MAG: hypothetical protein COX08_03810 [Candidatus Beckwithbacteria bacterium CG23_combo_of_CG06-09_8_20_14_all_34_8]
MNTQVQKQNPPANNQATQVPNVVKPPISETHSVLRPLQSQSATSIPVKKGNSMQKTKPIVISFLVILLGIASGYGLALARNGGTSSSGLKNEPGLQREVASNEITVGTKVGIADEKTFKDSTEGQLEKGGIDGEGSHHLVRPGGDSQTVYITSSVIDLDQFIGRKVKVWGETMAADKAGWFMDIGKLEVLE